MEFIKKHIFTLIRFLSIWLTVFGAYNMINNKGDLTINVATLTISLTIAILVMIAEFWYKPRD